MSFKSSNRFKSIVSIQKYFGYQGRWVDLAHLQKKYSNGFLMTQIIII